MSLRSVQAAVERTREDPMRRWAMIPALVLALLLGCAAPTPAMSEYDFDRLVSDLRSAGASAEVAGEPWDFKVFHNEMEAQAININGKRAFVLKYVDPAAAEAEATLISPDGYGVRGRQPGVGQFLEWTDTPHFFKKGKLIVFYIGNEESILNVLKDVLGPQFAGG